MKESADIAERADVVGMWVTADGFIRQELRADGHYDEARGHHEHLVLYREDTRS